MGEFRGKNIEREGQNNSHDFFPPTQKFMTCKNKHLIQCKSKLCILLELDPRNNN